MKLSSFVLLPGVAVFALAAFVQDNNPLLEKSASTLHDAKTLTMTYTVRPVSGSPIEYKLSYSRDGMVRIESPTEYTIATGTTIYTYTRAGNSYTETKEDDKSLGAVVASDEVYPWAAFFLKEPLKGVLNAKTGSKRNLKGRPVTEVTFDLKGEGNKSGTIFIDDQTHIPMGMSLKRMKGNTAEEILVLATDVKLDAPVSEDLFAFRAPSGAKKVEASAQTTATASWATVSGIFKANCTGCHGPSGKGGLDLTSYASTMAGGRGGPCVISGDPDGSSLVKYIRGTLTPRMPVRAAPLSDDQIQTIAAWIKAGAKQD